jgi:hypothetical protein
MEESFPVKQRDFTESTVRRIYGRSPQYSQLETDDQVDFKPFARLGGV